MVSVSLVIQHYALVFGIEVNHSLLSRSETYLALFTLFAVGAIGLVDDYLNVREI